MKKLTICVLVITLLMGLTLFTCTYGGRTRTGFEPPFVSKTASLRVKRRFNYVNDTKY